MPGGGFTQFGVQDSRTLRAVTPAVGAGPTAGEGTLCDPLRCDAWPHREPAPRSGSSRL